jgi:hypothetical protein
MSANLSDFNIDNINIGMNEDTGELEITSKPVEVKPEQKEQQVEQPPSQQPDVYSNLDARLSSLTDLVTRQSNAIALLLQAQQNPPQPEQSLGEDNDRLVDSITKKVGSQVEQLQQQVTPLLEQQRIEREIHDEWITFSGKFPDAIEYAPGMQYLMTSMPDKNWKIHELYALAKGMNLKPQQQQAPTQQQTPSQQQQTNVTPIRRDLPPKIESTNSNLQSKEIRQGKEGLRDALNQAMEELGFGT